MSNVERFLAFIFYMVCVVVFGNVIHGTLMVPAGIEGVWYYTSIGYLLLSLLSAPFFSKPTDTIATSITAALIVLTISIPSSIPWAATFEIGKLFIAFYCGFALISAIIAILSKPKDMLQSESIISKVAFKISDRLGRGEAIFSFVFIWSVLGAFIYKPQALASLLIFWLAMILVRPHEIVVYLIKELKSTQRTLGDGVIGTVRAFENPGIALISLSEGTLIKPGVPIAVLDRDSRIRLGLSVGDAEVQGERWMRVLLNKEPLINKTSEGKELIPHQTIKPLTAFKVQLELIEKTKIGPEGQSLFTGNLGPLVGFVAEESNTDVIQVELLPTEKNVYEGRLVTTFIKGCPVLYQIIDAVTQSESLEKKNSTGYHRASARKVGRWEDKRKRFISTRWLPDMYAPVYLKEDKPIGFQAEGVGHIPGSSFTVSINPHFAVTHNTAILGVLGTGKTCLALELIIRLISQRIKVICFDITGQYKIELSSYCKLDIDEQNDSKIDNAIITHATHVDQDVEKGGNQINFRAEIDAEIKAFMEDDKRYIRVYNPERYNVTRQDSRPYQGTASMATLSPVEVTRIISEAILAAVSDKFSSTEARVCVVYEEAHSLIPEWNSISFEGDRKAAMGTAKAILQGRKYGLGCIVITQRTANVTKSVLNQCNTVFALRTFDATGMEFLANYIGRDYTDVLSALEERHAIVYGRAVSSDSPLIIQLNNREEFMASCSTEEG